MPIYKVLINTIDGVDTVYASGDTAGKNINDIRDDVTVLGGTDGRSPALRRQWQKAANIASASVMDLSTVEGNYVNVTGTTTITQLGVVQAGTVMVLYFSGALTIQNSANINLAGARNAVVPASSEMAFVSNGGNNWNEIARTFPIPQVPTFSAVGDYGKQLQMGNGVGGTAGTTTQSVYVVEVSVTFPSAYAATPIVLPGGTTTGIASWSGARSIGTGGFTYDIWSNSSGGVFTGCSWLAIG